MTLPAALLAQDGAPALGPGAGWASAGLLSSVLGWLLFVHLPAKDKLLREMIEAKDVLLAAQLAMFIEAQREGRRDFKEALAGVVETFKAEVAAARKTP